MAWITLIVLLAACATAAVTGALFKPGAWYKALDKPPWTPPNWLFPVAWTLLYIAIAVAAWRVALRGGELAPLALALWTWQLVLNAIWSPVFFGLRRLRAGAITLGMLWLVITVTAVIFAQLDAFAAWLLVPYWLWIGYASTLNLVIWRRQPGEQPLVPSEQPRMS